MANIHLSRAADVSPSVQRPMAKSKPHIQNVIQQKIRCKNRDSTASNSFHSFTIEREFYGKMFYLNQRESHNTCSIFVYTESQISVLNLHVASADMCLSFTKVHERTPYNQLSTTSVQCATWLAKFKNVFAHCLQGFWLRSSEKHVSQCARVSFFKSCSVHGSYFGPKQNTQRRRHSRSIWGKCVPQVQNDVKCSVSFSF